MRKFTYGSVTYVGAPDDVSATARSFVVMHIGAWTQLMKPLALYMAEAMTPTIKAMIKAFDAFGRAYRNTAKNA